jgi:DNA-binding CsgD family transcriptional regulator
MDPIGLAHEAPTYELLATRALAELGREVGMEAAFLVRTKEEAPVTVGLDPGRLVTVAAEGYGRELAPVKAAALARRGVAVDADILGTARVRASRYHRDLAAPMGGTHSLLAYLRLRGEDLGLLMLGRCGRPFHEGEVRAVEALLPGLALAVASYERPRGGLDLSLLSPRERDVLDLLRLGYTNREIAGAFGTSPHTVRNQLSSVFQKIGATTRAEAVAIASS